MLMYGRNQQYCKTIIHQLKNKTKAKTKPNIPSLHLGFSRPPRHRPQPPCPPSPVPSLPMWSLPWLTLPSPLASRPVPPPGLSARCVCIYSLSFIVTSSSSTQRLWRLLQTPSLALLLIGAFDPPGPWRISSFSASPLCSGPSWRSGLSVRAPCAAPSKDRGENSHVLSAHPELAHYGRFICPATYWGSFLTD